ncbi:MAG: hypothetical protein M0Z41_20330 [Peptococcaceae bacterium]|jgi:hypothetical protein|nr:hypothetical protein [Peptococcaceae bacterium]
MSDELRTRGINSQGFGIIAKSVMRDPTLIAGAKALYAYIYVRVEQVQGGTGKRREEGRRR